MAQEFNLGLNLTQIKYFQHKVHKAMRTRSLSDQLASESGDNVVQRVTELKGTTWGYKAIMTLVPDDTSYGTVGDSQLEDREAGITAHDTEITFDQFRKAFKNEGVIADRTSWVQFGQQASDQLSYWAIDIKDRLLMNTLAGVAYTTEVDGKPRGATCEWGTNRFAGDVTAPSAKRHFQVGAAGAIVAPAHGSLESTHVPTWNTFIDMRTELPMMRIKPIRGKWGNGNDLYICLVHPRTMGQLKKDTTFQQNLRDALQRGEKNPIFAGAESYVVDGILIISHRYAYTTLAATATNKWGTDGNVNGARILFLGAQAIGMVEMGSPKWVTKTFDYENRQGISMAIKFGYKKTLWPDQYSQNSLEDFGTVALDCAIPAGSTTYTI